MYHKYLERKTDVTKILKHFARDLK